MVSSNFPSRPFRLEERTSIYNQQTWWEGNQNLVHSELWIIKNSYSPTHSQSGAAFTHIVNGVTVNSNGNFGFDFRNSDALLLSAVDRWFPADGAGNMWVSIGASCNAPILGYAEVSAGFWAPRIPRPPVTTPWWVFVPDGATATSIVVHFGYYPSDNGGSAITQYEVQWDDDPAFGSPVSFFFGPGSSGNETLAGLPSGQLGNMRVRTHNAWGPSGWSPAIQGSTLASVKVSDGGAWRTPQTAVSDGTSWRAPEVYYSKDGAWVAPLQ